MAVCELRLGPTPDTKSAVCLDLGLPVPRLGDRHFSFISHQVCGLPSSQPAQPQRWRRRIRGHGMQAAVPKAALGHADSSPTPDPGHWCLRLRNPNQCPTMVLTHNPKWRLAFGVRMIGLWNQNPPPGISVLGSPWAYLLCIPVSSSGQQG